MNPQILLDHDDFQMEFRTILNPAPLSENSFLADLLGANGFVLQERIILSPDTAKRAAEFSARTVDPSRCCAPLIIIGHSSLPVQYASVIARPKQGRARIERTGQALRVTSDGTALLFSDPLLSEQDSSVYSFSRAFDGIGRTLREGGMDQNALVRTWLYLENILRDYDALNAARKMFFDPWRPADAPFMPASTGIEGRTPASKPLSVQFCAFSGNHLSIRQQPSPLQNEATAYGKLFSRCAVVEFPRSRLAYISGTAAIDKDGRSLYPGDLEKQMKFTLEVLSAILRELNGHYAHTAQAVVYLRRHQDLDLSRLILMQADFPVERCQFLADTTVCRDELLCEIELTAVTEHAHL